MEGAGWDWRNNAPAGRSQTVGSLPAVRV
jgi:hypothetical protein